jgi:hypothetical protein
MKRASPSEASLEKKLKKNIFGQCLYFSLSTHKQGILGQLLTTALQCFPNNLTPWRVSNPGLLFLFAGFLERTPFFPPKIAENSDHNFDAR